MFLAPSDDRHAGAALSAQNTQQCDQAPLPTMANSISQGAIANIMAGSTGANGYNPVVQVRNSRIFELLALFFKIKSRLCTERLYTC